MLKNDYLKDKNRPERKGNRYVSLAGSLLFYLGILIILSGLLFMLYYLKKSDVVMHLWLPYMFTGIAMVCISFLLKLPLYKSWRRGRRMKE